MAGSVNKVILVGHLGRDPEVRYTQNNQKIVHLSVATSERWKDRQSGDPRERTEWHRVVIFNENLADIAERYLRKGSPVYLEGTLQTRKWTDQSGQERPRPRSWCRASAASSRSWAVGMRAAGPERADDLGAGTGYSSPAPRSGPSERGLSGPGGGGRGRPTSIADQLDDDIPF